MQHCWILTSITSIAMLYMSVIMDGVRIHHAQKKSFSRSNIKHYKTGLTASHSIAKRQTKEQPLMRLLTV